MNHLDQQLRELGSLGLRRHPRLPAGLDFSSNDYLGLSSDEAFAGAVIDRLRQYSLENSLFAPSSRSLRGETALHQDVERELAAFAGSECSLVFPSGWQAVESLLTTILDSNTFVFSDQSNHASIVAGIRHSGTRKHIYPHRQLAHALSMCAPPPGSRTFVVTESLFSMDGDIADLHALSAQCAERGFLLVVDDAHGTGVFGSDRGSGLVEEAGIAHSVAASIFTFSKSLGLQGGSINGSATLIDYLRNHCRSFIYTAAVSPLLLIALREAIGFVRREPARRKQLQTNLHLFRSELARHGLTATSHVNSPIVPILVGDNFRALRVAQALQSEGFDVRAVRPPSVPAGTARLRVSIHANHKDSEISALAGAIPRALHGA